MKGKASNAVTRHKNYFTFFMSVKSSHWNVKNTKNALFFLTQDARWVHSADQFQSYSHRGLGDTDFNEEYDETVRTRAPYRTRR